VNTIFWFENVKGRDNPEDLSVDGKIILEWVAHPATYPMGTRGSFLLSKAAGA